jgi:hypothetical protein
MSGTAGAKRPDSAGDQDLEAVETLIDEIGDQSFPASDPPAWGVVRARLDLARPNAQPEHPDIPPAESA